MAKATSSIIGRSLLGIGGLSNEFVDQLAKELTAAKNRFYTPADLIAIARARLREFEPLLVEHLSDATLAGWIAGFDEVASLFPRWLQEEFATSIRNRPPPIKPPTPPRPLFGMFDDEPRLKLPIIENAAQRLLERNILTRQDFDIADDLAKRDAFTIAGGLEADTIERLRQFLVEDLNDGTSLEGFRERVDEHLGSSPIAPGHLENVYRTNIQGAIRDGRETLRSNPIVAEVFPYQAYVPIRDARARPEHSALETLGLDGTGVYRTDDPFWSSFTPPWDYQCRCSTRLMTVDAAARAGVKEAQEWMRTGFPPVHPEYRLAHIPFEPKPGWGSRGRVGVVM